MSLKVWLPLGDNFKQQGQDNIPVTNLGQVTIIDSNGKTGSGYASFPGTVTGCLRMPPVLTATDNFTISFWVKFNALNANQTFFSQRIASNALGYTIFYITGSGLRFDDGASLSTTEIFNTTDWFHIVCCRDATKKYIYVNGQKITETTKSNTSASNLNTNYSIIGGCQSTAAGTVSTANLFNGFLNDYRIYDHCLSPLEIKELSQGLVLHYKLDNNGHRNLFQTDPTLTLTIPSGNTSVYSSYVYIDPFIKNNDILKEGTIYTIIYDYIVNSSGTGSVYVYTQLNTSRSTPSISQTMIRTANATGRIVETFHTTADQANYSSTFRIRWRITSGQEGNSITIKNVRMYLGSSEDIDYINDNSGYEHHATKTGLPLLETSTDSRYSTSLHFTGTNQYVRVTGLKTTGFGSTYTFAWWSKVADWAGKMVWGFSDGIKLNGIYNGNLWNTGDGTQNPLYQPGTTTAVTKPTVNEWHHFAMVANGTTCLVYQDGELWGQAKTFKQISGTTLVLNGWDTGTSYKNTDATVSDFRMYSTALSAEDVKKLYNTSVSVDNYDNIHAFEFIEKDITSVNKQGQFECTEINEIAYNNSNAQILNTSILRAREFIER